MAEEKGMVWYGQVSGEIMLLLLADQLRSGDVSCEEQVIQLAHCDTNVSEIFTG